LNLVCKHPFPPRNNTWIALLKIQLVLTMPAKPFLCHVGDHLGVMPDNFCQVSEERMTAFAAHVGVEDLDHAFDLEAEAEATDGDADAKQPTKPFPLPQTYRSIFSGQSSTSCCLYKRLLYTIVPKLHCYWVVMPHMVQSGTFVTGQCGPSLGIIHTVRLYDLASSIVCVYAQHMLCQVTG